MKEQQKGIQLTDLQVNRLANDAAITASAILIYVPPHQKRAHAAAARILRRLGFGKLAQKGAPR